MEYLAAKLRGSLVTMGACMRHGTATESDPAARYLFWLRTRASLMIAFRRHAEQGAQRGTDI